MIALRARAVWAAPPGAPDAVVRGVSLEVAAGEWLALTGPNGGGKSTFAMVLAGLWPTREGAVEFEGRPLTPGRPAGAREGVAVLLQDPSVQLLQSTVADELALAPRNLGRAEDEVAREVTRVAGALGLEADLGRDPATLSAGRQQLVLLGGALTARPRLLVADEAGAHLDASARARSLALIAAEVRRGMTVVWVTQDPDERAAAHRVLAIGGAGTDAEEAPDRTVRVWAGATGPPAMRIEVAAPPPDDGPRVMTRHPLVLEVGAQGVTALEGPNGAGKSVLLAAAAGVLDAPQVRVQRAGGDGPPPLLATQYPERELFAERVLDEVTWAAIERGVPRIRAEHDARAWIERLGGSPGLAERRVWGLSGGEKRLIQLAGALAAPAGLILLDEPTAGLDPARRRAVAAAVLERSDTTPMLIASQDLQWLDMVSERRLRLAP